MLFSETVHNTQVNSMPNKLNHTDPITPLLSQWKRQKKRMAKTCGVAAEGSARANAALVALLDSLDSGDVDDTRDAAVAELMQAEPNLIADIDGMVAKWAAQTDQTHLEVLAKLADKYASDESQTQAWLKIQIGLAIDGL